jgi:hypothetical protein
MDAHHFERDSGFEEDITALRATIVESMEENVCRIFTEKDPKSPLATWEMKSLGGEVMSAVPNLGIFSWTFCNVMNCREVLKRAGEVVAGPDADPLQKITPRNTGEIIATRMGSSMIMTRTRKRSMLMTSRSRTPTRISTT